MSVATDTTTDTATDTTTASPAVTGFDRVSPLEPLELPGDVIAGLPPTNTDAIPPLADHWKQLDLREILRRPAAFVSIGQSNSCYRPGGAQYAEGHAHRGTLDKTVRAAAAARRAGNFAFNWVGYSIFRDDYPKSDFDRVQYHSWTGAIDATPEQIAWDNTLVSELRELVEPGDREFFETAFQTAFVGTDLMGDLARRRVEVIVLAGIHLDWCIEGNARAARDNGFLPIVIGDTTGAQKPEQEQAAFERIKEFFAPVISTEEFVGLLQD